MPAADTKGGEESSYVGEQLDSAKGHWAHELLARYARWVPYFLCACLSYWYTFPLEQAGQCDLVSQQFASVVATVFFRNLLVLNIIYGGWHYVIHVSAWAKDGRLSLLKYNPEDQYAQGKNHLQREILYCNYGFLMSSAYEVLLLRLWATGTIPMLQGSLLTAWGIGNFLVVGYWRDFHFFFVHRFMHAWFKRGSKFQHWDFGAYMYKHVHSLHHKSYNPGPWSGAPILTHTVKHLMMHFVMSA
jgi:hypothetical protein